MLNVDACARLPVYWDHKSKSGAVQYSSSVINSTFVKFIAFRFFLETV